MALLDELKKQSAHKQQLEQQEKALQAQREAYYQSDMQPKMLLAMDYAQEMVKHLNIINAGTEVDYDIQGLGLIPLRHSQYTFKVDHLEQPHSIRIQFKYSSEKEYRLQLQGHEIVQQQIDYLCRYNLRYKSNYRKNDKHQITDAVFVLTPEVHAYVEILADIATSKISFTFSHINRLDKVIYSCAPDSLDAVFLDEFGKYVLGQDNQFLQTQLSEKERAAIRKNISKQRLLQQMQQQQQAIYQQQQLLDSAEQDENVLRHTLRKVSQLFRREPNS